MIKESEISNIKVALLMTDYEYADISLEQINYINENISMLGLYLSYLELNGIEYKVSCRPRNKFYINNCFVHRSYGNDYPFEIIESEGLFVCRGCCKGGHIVDFVGEVYDLSLDKILNILFSHINGTYNKLSNKEKNIYNKLFYKYYLKDKYLSISKEKKENLDNRIKRYIESSEKEIDHFKLAQRLGCSIEYVERFFRTEVAKEPSGPVLTKKKTPARNTGNK